MRITVTGATGLIGSRVVAALKQRQDDVTVLTRSPESTRAELGVEAVAWQAESEEAPVDALDGRDAVIHLAGEPVDQRWTSASKARIRSSRVDGTANLVAGLRQARQRPRTLISGSAVGLYGPHGQEPIDENTGPGSDFLAEVCVGWERAASQAQELGVRTVLLRTGIVLSADGGALKRMLPPFKAGVGGPVGGGAQMMPWIHVDDEVAMILAAIDGDAWAGAVNATAPRPVSNREFSKALGRALHRPSLAPVPAFAIRAIYGEMAQIVLTGQNAVPRAAESFGFSWRHAELDSALTDLLQD